MASQGLLSEACLTQGSQLPQLGIGMDKNGQEKSTSIEVLRSAFITRSAMAVWLRFLHCT